MLLIIIGLSCLVGFAVGYFLVWWFVLFIVLILALWLAYEARTGKPMPSTSGHTGTMLGVFLLLVPGMVTALLTAAYFNMAAILEWAHHVGDFLKIFLR